MNKMKQIAALTAMLVGVIMYASPAKSAVCFLPDDDGSCGGVDIEISDGSGSDDSKPETCEGFTISSENYDKMKDCFNFTYCTKSKNNEFVYKKGSKKSNTRWYGNWNACCTGGTVYDLREGKCCPAGGCVHECDAPKVWSSTLRDCVCPADRVENTTSKTCCPVGEHADGAICCPAKKHNDGGTCVCDANYIPDGNGGCKIPSVSEACKKINSAYVAFTSNDDCHNICPAGQAPKFMTTVANGACAICQQTTINININEDVEMIDGTSGLQHAKIKSLNRYAGFTTSVENGYNYSELAKHSRCSRNDNDYKVDLEIIGKTSDSGVRDYNAPSVSPITTASKAPVSYPLSIYGKTSQPEWALYWTKTLATENGKKADAETGGGVFKVAGKPIYGFPMADTNNLISGFSKLKDLVVQPGKPSDNPYILKFTHNLSDSVKKCREINEFYVSESESCYPNKTKMDAVGRDGQCYACNSCTIESDCRTGYTFIPDSPAHTDYNNRECGTCSKTYYIDIKPFIVNIDDNCAVNANADLSTDSSAKNDRFIIDNEVELFGNVNVRIREAEQYATLSNKSFLLKNVTDTWYAADYPKIADHHDFCELYKNRYPGVLGNGVDGKFYDCVGVDDSTYIYIRAKNKCYDFGTNNCVTLYIGNDNRTICYRTSKFSCTVY